MALAGQISTLRSMVLTNHMHGELSLQANQEQQTATQTRSFGRLQRPVRTVDGLDCPPVPPAVSPGNWTPTASERPVAPHLALLTLRSARGEDCPEHPDVKIRFNNHANQTFLPALRADTASSGGFKGAPSR